jgi:hypothetical protein
MKKFGEVLQEMGVENFLGMVDREQFGLDDDSVTHAVTVEKWLSVKEKSLFHHRTQNNPESIFRKMPKEWIETLRSTEHYALVAGTPVAQGEGANQDLFAGLK